MHIYIINIYIIIIIINNNNYYYYLYNIYNIYKYIYIHTLGLSKFQYVLVASSHFALLLVPRPKRQKTAESGPCWVLAAVATRCIEHIWEKWGFMRFRRNPSSILGWTSKEPNSCCPLNSHISAFALGIAGRCRACHVSARFIFLLWDVNPGEYQNQRSSGCRWLARRFADVDSFVD